MEGGQENKESLKEVKELSNIKRLYCLQSPTKLNTYTNTPCEEYFGGKMKVGIAHLGAMRYKTATAIRDGEPLNQSAPRKAIRHPTHTPWS